MELKTGGVSLRGSERQGSTRGKKTGAGVKGRKKGSSEAETSRRWGGGGRKGGNALATKLVSVIKTCLDVGKRSTNGLEIKRVF